MKCLYIITAFVLLTAIESCGPTIYIAGNFKTIQPTQKTIAILPFDVSITGRQVQKGETVDQIMKDESDYGFSAQNSVYTYLLKRLDQYTVQFQDVDQSNAILLKNGITYTSLKSHTAQEIAELLGVDGVIGGSIIMARPMSEGGAVALGVLTGTFGNTNKVTASLMVHNKTDGELLWKYDYQASGSIGSSIETLMNALMNNVSKRFPYKQD